MSVRPSVCHTPIFCRILRYVLKLFRSRPHHSSFSNFHTKRYGNILAETPLMGGRVQGVSKNRDFRPIYRFISEIIQNRAILTTANQQKVVYDLSNGAIFNDLERPRTQILRSRYSLTLNISETVRDTDIVTMRLRPIRKGVIWNDLE